MPHVTVTVLIRRFSVYRIITNAGVAIRSWSINTPPFPHCQTKVETQNFASPVQPVAVCLCNNLPPTNAFLASHKQPIAINTCNNLLSMNAYLARETQNFTFLQRMIAQKGHNVITFIDCTYLLVRRKILRLYRLTPSYLNFIIALTTGWHPHSGILKHP